MIPLPSKVKFWHVKNGKKLSHSKEYDTENLETSELRAEMIMKDASAYDLNVGLKWVSDISRNKHEANALLGAHDILLYDIEIKFEALEGVKKDVRPDQVHGMKLKVIAGTKAFDLNGELDPFKATRFSRIVYFLVKSEEEDFSFSLEKGPRIIAKGVIGTDELLSYHPNVIRKKLLDPFTGRTVASVRCRGEKAKNLSLPQNNRFWKKCSQGKLQTMILEFSQLSLWGTGEPCGVVIRSEEEESVVPDVPDFSVFKLETELPPPVAFIVGRDGNIYFKLVPNEGGGDCGMAVVNPKELRLGSVPLTLAFYKQKEFVC
jgi:hypothetical protein